MAPFSPIPRFALKLPPKRRCEFPLGLDDQQFPNSTRLYNLGTYYQSPSRAQRAKPWLTP
ncbi:hypothetical protein EMIT051CA3_110005 [Pseudomonas chlororaphis]